jgi:hypothetical protein
MEKSAVGEGDAGLCTGTGSCISNSTPFRWGRGSEVVRNGEPRTLVNRLEKQGSTTRDDGDACSGGGGVVVRDVNG